MESKPCGGHAMQLHTQPARAIASSQRRIFAAASVFGKLLDDDFTQLKCIRVVNMIEVSKRKLLRGGGPVATHVTGPS